MCCKTSSIGQHCIKMFLNFVLNVLDFLKVELFNVDIIGQFVNSYGNKYILVVVE